MEFLVTNVLNAVSQLTVDSASSTVSNIFNPRIELQYISDGFNNDLTTTSVVVSFDATTTIDRLALLNMNVKGFTAFYNGATANTFAITSTGSTVASDFSSNSESSMFMSVTQVDATSVTFDLKTTMVADAEKAIGLIYLGSKSLTFPRVPSAKNYKPKHVPKEVTHKLSDGGTRIHRVDKKWNVRVKYKHFPESSVSDFKSIWNSEDARQYVAFPTMASWDNVFFECVWPGPFPFHELSDNAVNAGHSGEIRLEETPS